MTCQKDFLFDPKNGWCDFPENVCCESRDCDNRSCNKNCNNIGDDFKCPEADGFFADDKNCTRYYQCSDNVPTLSVCEKSKYIVKVAIQK